MHTQRLRWHAEICRSHFVVLLGILAVLPTILNRFPLVYFDSAAYISAWTTNHHLLYPPFYPLFVWLTSHAVNIYFTVVSQAALFIYVLLVFFKAALRPCRQRTFLLGLIACILLLTQVAWLINWLMPDLFCGLGAVCIMSYVFFNETMGFRDRVNFFLIAVFSTIVATANVLVLVPFGVACFAIRKLLLQKTSALKLVAVAVLFGAMVIGVSIGANLVISGRPVMNPTWAALGFNKLMDAGIAQEYLHANCSSHHFQICEHLGELDEVRDGSGFLWRGLAERTDAWHDPSGDLGRAVLAITRAHLKEVVSVALHDTVTLFFSASLGRGDLIAYPKGTGIYFNVAEFYPTFFPDFVAAPQQTGDLLKWFPRRYYSFLTYLSYGLLVVFTIVFAARSDRLGVSLGLAATILIVLGVAVHGCLATPDARYHVKVSWVAWVVVIVGICRWYASRASWQTLRIKRQPDRPTALTDRV